MTQNNYR